MKKAVILHAMEQNSKGHWYPWLKKELESTGYEVWVPDLPNANHPNTEEMTEFLVASGWDFKDNLVIGHSSGAVEVLYLLQAIPLAEKIKTAVAVSSFDRPVTGMETQHDKMFVGDLAFENIKTKSEKILFLHGSDDPWCPVEQAQYLAKQTSGELVLVEGGGHFSTSLDPKYTEFPELIKILEDRQLL